jgi:predicted AAA+ superfamily ATPase
VPLLRNKTVDKYLRLLEQSFVIFRLPSFARNLRQELAASNKFYFYDLGVRNGVIGDYVGVVLHLEPLRFYTCVAEI